MAFTAHFSDDAFIDNVGFNLGGPSLPIPTVTEVQCTAGACAGFSAQHTGNNLFSVVNSGANAKGKVSGFDLGLLFGNNQLSDGKTATVVVKGTGINVDALKSNFNYDNQTPPSNWIGQLLTAAKVKNIGPGGSSGEIAGKDPPNGASVPGPLPILGGVAAFQVSRRLRRRLRHPEPRPATT